MPKRVSLTLSDSAAAILADRSRIPYLDQGKWVSQAIELAAAQSEATRQDPVRSEISRIEQELSRLQERLSQLKTKVETKEA